MSIYIHAMHCIIYCSVIKMHYLLVINLSWFWVPCTVLLFLIFFSESILCFFKIWLTLRETQWHQKQIRRGGYGLGLILTYWQANKGGGLWLCLTLQKKGGGLSPPPKFWRLWNLNQLIRLLFAFACVIFTFYFHIKYVYQFLQCKSDWKNMYSLLLLKKSLKVE